MSLLQTKWLVLQDYAGYYVAVLTSDDVVLIVKGVLAVMTLTAMVFAAGVAVGYWLRKHRGIALPEVTAPFVAQETRDIGTNTDLDLETALMPYDKPPDALTAIWIAPHGEVYHKDRRCCEGQGGRRYPVQMRRPCSQCG